MPIVEHVFRHAENRRNINTVDNPPEPNVTTFTGILIDNLPIIIGGVSTLIGVYIVYWLGLRAYFSQKEFENVRLRYLDAGLDLASAQVEYALGVFRSNWMLLLRYAKLCRDLNAPFDAADFFAQFRELDQGQFQITPAHRIRALLPSEVVWSVYQEVFAFVGTANDKMKADFGSALNMLSKNPASLDRAAFFSEAEKLAQELNDASQKFYIYLSELNNLAQVFEQQRLKRKDLQRFSKQKDVKEIVTRLEAKFPTDNSA